MTTEPIGKAPRRGISIVESPDDGGFYAERYDLDDPSWDRESRIYDTREEIIDAMRVNSVEWDRRESPRVGS